MEPDPTPAPKPDPMPDLAEIAKQIRDQIGSETNRLIFFIGTGVSRCMVHRKDENGEQTEADRLCDWVPFLREATVRMPDCPEKTLVEYVLRQCHPDKADREWISFLHAVAAEMPDRPEKTLLEHVLQKCDAEQEKGEWGPALRAAAEGMPDSPEKTLVEYVLQQCHTEDIPLPVAGVVALAHTARDAFERSHTWDKAVEELIQIIMGNEDHERRWSKMFWKMGADLAAAEKRAKEGGRETLRLPLILTTNYDTLVSRALNARCLINPDLKSLSHDAPSDQNDPDPDLGDDEEKESQPPAFELLEKEGETDIPAHLRRCVDVPRLWNMHLEGLLAPGDQFVHHVHGAVNDPKSLIFDAADYERVIQGKLWESLADLIYQKDSGPVIFLGCGETLFDRHLKTVTDKLKSLHKSPRGFANKVKKSSQKFQAYWVEGVFVDGFDEKKSSGEPISDSLNKEAERLAEARLKAMRAKLKENLEGPVANSICPIARPGFDWIPDWLDAIIRENI